MVEKGDIKITKEIKDNMFVDDLTCGGDNEEEAFLIKKKQKTKLLLMEDSHYLSCILTIRFLKNHESHTKLWFYDKVCKGACPNQP